MLKIEQVLRDDNGNNILNDFFESIVVTQKHVIVIKHGLTGLYNVNTLKKILSCEWEKVIFELTFIITYKLGKYALFDDQGNKVLECEWDRIKLYSKGILVIKEEKQGFFNYKGNKVLDCEWKRIEPLGSALVAYKGNGSKRVVFDYNGICLNK